MYKLELHKVFTWLKSASHCRIWRIVFKNYSLQLVQVRLSQCYNKVNTAVDCCAVPVYRHAFYATALDGDVQLNSTFEWLSSQKWPPVRSEFEAWRDNHKDRVVKECYLHHYVIRIKFVPTVGNSQYRMGFVDFRQKSYIFLVIILLTILPTGSDLSCIPLTVWHLSCSSATSSLSFFRVLASIPHINIGWKQIFCLCNI